MSGTVTCDIGSIRAGETSTIAIVLTAGPAGVITNNVSTTSVTTDTDLSNNSASATTTVAGLCQPGTYWNGATCAAAFPGSFVSTAGATASTPCALEAYQDLAGQTSCKLASPGTFVDTIGSAVATPCALGSYQDLAGQTSCKLASPGTFVDTIGSAAATACALGSYQDLAGQTSCKLASPGTFVDTIGSAAATACALGSYQDLAGQTSCKLDSLVGAKPGLREFQRFSTSERPSSVLGLLMAALALRRRRIVKGI